MREEAGPSWIDKLTEIALDVEQVGDSHRELVRERAMAFFDEAIEICRTIQQIEEIEEEQDGFYDILMQSGQNLIAHLVDLDRSAMLSKDELCSEMYRFISLLSQRMNFEVR